MNGNVSISLFLFSQLSWIIVVVVIMLRNNHLLKRNAALELSLANEMLKPALYDMFEEFRDKK
jgi:hypothetical protein